MGLATNNGFIGGHFKGFARGTETTRNSDWQKPMQNAANLDSLRIYKQNPFMAPALMSARK